MFGKFLAISYPIEVEHFTLFKRRTLHVVLPTNIAVTWGESTLKFLFKTQFVISHVLNKLINYLSLQLST